ncbi:MAG: TetR/AcrR family transcriptional regulator [Acidimicrobiales bacterium]
MPAAATAVAPVSTELEGRLVAAMLECIGRWGVAKTTADDIARAAGVSRATLYRAFPGGKDVAFEALLRHEVSRFFDRVEGRFRDADTLEDLLVVGAVEAADFLLGHEALGYLLRHEPNRVIPAYGHLQGGLAIATGFLAPHLARFVLDPRVATEGAELVVRLLLSYAADPSPTVDLTDPDSVRRFVHTFVIPALTHKEP